MGCAHVATPHCRFRQSKRGGRSRPPPVSSSVVLAVPGGRSCSAGSALCTPARQSLSHDLSATIRDGTASSHGSRPGQTSPPGRVLDLRAEYTGAADYLIFFRIPLEGDGALKYHILVGVSPQNHGERVVKVFL